MRESNETRSLRDSGEAAFAPSGLVTLTTDFGLRDWYVGVLKGVMAGLCPALRFIDLSHDIEPQDVAGGAFLLAEAAPWFPPGTVHLAVVDPGVGSTRAAVIVIAGGQALVGPDNGILAPAAARLGGGAWRRLENRAWRREPLSQTFHGRDLFAPAAARLAAGAPPAEAGPPHSGPVSCAWPEPREVRPGLWQGEILYIDRFGNAITSFRPEALGISARGAVSIAFDGGGVEGLAACYAELAPDRPGALVGSCGLIEIALRGGAAAAALGLRRGSSVDLAWPPSAPVV